MSVRLVPRRLVGGGVLLLAIAGAGLDRSVRESAAAPEKPVDLSTAKYYGVGTCEKCHNEPGKYKPELVKLTEYTTWRTEDKHSHAYAVLEGPRGRQMAKLLGTDGKPFKVSEEDACLNCHAMNYTGGHHAEGFSIKDGVSCDTCHGPAQFWLDPHAYEPKLWRAMTPEQKEEWGMYNVRDPARRARLCLSCHVGSPGEGKVVTHAMYAAGHPPLQSFELASFSARMPPHWYELNKVPFLADDKTPQATRANYYYDKRDSVHSRLVVAGSLTAFRVSMDLFAVRARLGAKVSDADARGAKVRWPPAWMRPYLKGDLNGRFPELVTGPRPIPPGSINDRWPEVAMAQADCYACHHDLKSGSPRQAGRDRPRFTRVAPPSWPFALLNAGRMGHGLPVSGIRKDDGALGQGLTALDTAYEDYLFGDPGKVADASRNLVTWADGVLAEGPKPIEAATAAKLLRELCNLPSGASPDYDSARQIAWAFQAIHTEWPTTIRDAGKADNIIERWEATLNLNPDFARARRKQLVVTVLASERLADVLEKKDREELEKTFFKPLQDLHDEEWAEAAKRRDEYDPAAFKVALKELAGLIK